MEGTEEFWDAYWTEIESAKFSLIAAQLLLEETDKPMTRQDLISYKRRHAKHLRVCYRHLRKAARLRKRIERFERKHNG